MRTEGLSAKTAFFSDLQRYPFQTDFTGVNTLCSQDKTPMLASKLVRVGSDFAVVAVNGQVLVHSVSGV